MTIASTATQSITNSSIYPKSLFQKVLGNKFYDMPARLQELHSPDGSKAWVGEARSQAGETWLARLISRTIDFGVPSSQDSGTYERLEVTFECLDKSENWQRNFNGHCFNSYSTLREQADGDSVRYIAVENFGLFQF